MKILCTHPGRYGDLLWALPTVRALSRSVERPIDLLLSPSYSAASFQTLLMSQPYIGIVQVAEDWAIAETAPMTPRVPPTLPDDYDLIVHLGYDGWPSLPLPREIYRLAKQQVKIDWPLDLDTRWITPTSETLPTHQIAVGFSDEHFELKFGLYWLLREHFIHDLLQQQQTLVNVSGGPRWWHESHSWQKDWDLAAGWIANATVFVGCCSALHVLACAVGTPVICVEPAPARHHPIFYPLGTERVRLLLGGDGRPTVDSRHLIDAIEAVLAVAA